MSCRKSIQVKMAAQHCVEPTPTFALLPSHLACGGAGDSSVPCQRGRVGAAHTNR